MERYHGSRWPKGIGLLAATLVVISLSTYHPFDPTLLNLLSPSEGVHNALGLAGALVGGSLLEGFGAASWLIPLLIGNWFAFPRRRPRLMHYVAHGGLLLLFAASFHGLWSHDPTPGAWRPGLLGWAGGNWAESTAGSVLGGALLLGGVAYSLTRIVYFVSWRRRSAEIFAFGRYFLSRGDEALRHSTRAGAHAVAAAGDVLRSGFAALAGDLLAAGRILRRTVYRWRPFPYRPALAHRSRRMGGGVQGAAAIEKPVPHPEVERSDARGANDAFDAWFAQNDSQPQKSISTGDNEPAEIRAADDSSTARISDEQIAKWEEHLRRYQENMDLDWPDKLLNDASRPLEGAEKDADEKRRDPP